MQQHCSKFYARRPPPPPPPPDPGDSSTFSEHGHVAYQIKGNHKMQQHGSTYFAHRPFADPKTLLLGSKGHN